MRSIISLFVAVFLATAVQCSAERGQDHGVLAPFYHKLSCSPGKAGDCASCGADYVQCGSDDCYNPKAGETCCQSQYACPAQFNCSSTGSHCVTNNATGGPGCDDGDDDDDNYSSTSAAVVSTTSSTSASTTTGPPVSVVTSTSDSNSTTFTTTITSTTTNTVTVSATLPACGLSDATTGLPMTSSTATYGNFTTVALNTTTSTISVTNVTVHPTTHPASLNATKPTSSISPPISSYKGAASGLQGQASTSLFALACSIYVAALLI
ncbi:hypothetical protein A1O3_01411 [Capronia epimyces CBS 606.96]|uniref:Uncharacterized protein n=1 Tax=Capronia epimyces CBS 606.96 TaxID=1182542 RepID=W9YJ20_9EURO|nr:uncharacterized protein A1O3_01411 [Capronia epimyces CBS 606.96]EXJ92857.1 hypothetical protein A1O3_01411 [Capronia epimyces CBS 606.96]